MASLSFVACSTTAARPSTSARLSSRDARFAGNRVALRTPPAEAASARGSLMVVAGKGKGKQMFRSRAGAQQRPQMPPTPPVDPDNEEFVLFVRSKKLPQWIPLSVVKGGTSANLLVKSMKGSFAQSTFRDTLVRNIGEVLYKDRVEIENSLKTQFPMMKNATAFEYGFKIRDKTRPNAWYVAEDIMMIPPEGELPKPPVEELKEKATGFLSRLSGKSS